MSLWMINPPLSSGSGLLWQRCCRVINAVQIIVLGRTLAIHRLHNANELPRHLVSHNCANTTSYINDYALALDPHEECYFHTNHSVVSALWVYTYTLCFWWMLSVQNSIIVFYCEIVLKVHTVCPAFFMSCIFMSPKFVRHFHVRQFHVLHF